MTLRSNNSSNPDDVAIYVSTIVPGGAAATDGRLQPKDKIVAANGVDFSHITHADAIKAIKALRLPAPVYLIMPPVRFCRRAAHHRAPVHQRLAEVH